MIEFIQILSFAMLGLLSYLAAIVLLPTLGAWLILGGMAACFHIREARGDKK